MSLIEVKNAYKCYGKIKKHSVYALTDVNLTIEKGEIVGLVGESGCGKSTLGKIFLKLEKLTSGKVFFNGQDITNFSFNQMLSIRKNMQMIFQNSSNVFNPYFTVRQVLSEPLNNYFKLSYEEKEKRMTLLLKRVGLNNSYLERYGNELSGGQRQRIGIARALILNPEFVVCDEPVSSVDYAIRNQLLTLLLDLKHDFGLTYLFISHDLSAVNKICTKVVIMYLGNIMEIIPRMDENVEHPYSKALLAAALSADPHNRSEKKILFKETDEIFVPKKGCAFQNRCLYAKEICKNKKPILTQIKDGHYVSCHLCKI
ncbi:oligopeptide/dipeptide ABC transporter ATP-binding protein [Anaerovorax odorimutans]|uniref:oligopeptide/dipeptide ABC transporter ATP-binding protein n=1 Tax=Anaerovorax odorimutans TaxID=109327 RepID=UPI0003F9BEEC|nr:ABC transporter ATP-binding protein [Anaerovorax odorimutans]